MRKFEIMEETKNLANARNGEMRNNKGRKAKALIDNNDQLRSVKRLLDKVLLEADSLPNEIRQKITAVRDTVWEAFKAEEESINSSTR